MKKRKVNFFVQIFGVAVLAVGNFYTAGQAIADVVSTGQVAADNARILDKKDQEKATAKIGDAAKTTFDLTVGGKASSGRVSFKYNDDYLKIKNKEFKFTEGDTEVILDNTGKNSTIQWKNAVDETNLEVVLPVEFKRVITEEKNLFFEIDGQKLELPVINISENEDKKVDKTVPEPEENSAKSETHNSIETSNAIDELLTEETQQKQKEQEQKQQSNAEQAQELLAKQKEADKRKAAEKNNTAIKDNQDTKVGKVAENDAANHLKTDRSKNRETASQSGLPSGKSAITSAADDADGEVPERSQEFKQQIKTELPATGAFATENGRDLSTYFTDQAFFDSIVLEYKDGDGKQRTMDIPPFMDSPLELPEILRTNNNVKAKYGWSTDNVEKAINGYLGSDDFTIQDGDFYTFDIKGLKFDYNGKEDYSQDIKIQGKTVGTLNITNVGDDIQRVTITFLPGEIQSSIDYFAEIETEIDAKSDEISFGEVATEEGKIEVRDADAKLTKQGEFTTEDGLTNLDLITWNSVFTTKEGTSASEVTLRENFQNGYSSKQADVDYEFIITGSDGKRTTIDGQTAKELVSGGDGQAKDIKFDSKMVGGARITRIEVKITTPVTNHNQGTYHNQISANNINFGDGETVNLPAVSASLTREDSSVKKAWNVDKDGKIKYTIDFTVGENQQDFTLIDYLKTNKFTFSSVKNDYKLTPDDDGGITGVAVDSENEQQKLTVEFKSLAAGKYTLEYSITPKEGTTVDDYQDVTNTVIWNDEKKASVADPGHNQKRAIDHDWNKMTSDWAIDVNQTDMALTGNQGFTISEGGADLDWAAYFKTLQANVANLDQYLTITGAEGNIGEYQATVEDNTIKVKWELSGDTFEIGMADGKLVIDNLKLPDQNKKFTLELKNVPIDQEQFLNNSAERICNEATVNYNDREHNVRDCFSVPNWLKNNISKSGQFDKDFEDNRIINWTTTFNHKQYLGNDENKILTDEGIDITDVVGQDTITGAENATSRENLQEIKDLLRESLKVSLHKIATNGQSINTSASGTKELNETDFEVVEEVDENQKVQFILKLSPSGYEKYQEGFKIFRLKYQSKVTKLATNSDARYEHLKSWKFNNQVTVRWDIADNGYKQKAQANASVTYTDNGYLLNKAGKANETMQTITETDGTVHEHNLVDWSVVLNGNGYSLNSPVQVSDVLSGDHYHLETTDKNYQLRIFEANRVTQNNGSGNVSVGYEKNSARELSSNDFSVKYSSTLNTMQVTFTDKVETPLIMEYHTVAAKNQGATYTNKVQLSVNANDFSQEEKVHSSVQVGASYETYAVRLTKVDKNNPEKTISGVSFKLMEKDNTGSSGWKETGKTATTNENGIASFTGLYTSPTYRIEEVQGIENYNGNYVSEEFTGKRIDLDDEDANPNVLCLTAENYRTTDLTIKKVVKDAEPIVADDTFGFEVRATDDKGVINRDFNGEFDYTTNSAAKGTIKFSNGVAEDLPRIKADQTITISGLPQHLYYQVIELDFEAYTTTNKLDNARVVESNGNGSTDTDVFQLEQGANAFATIATFTNTYKTGVFQFSKSIRGANADQDRGKDFTFKLEKMTENGDKVDNNFTGKIKGEKQVGSTTSDVWFNFQNGVSKTILTAIDSEDEQNITLKTGNSYKNIKLPANAKIKVYEQKDNQYTETSYQLDDGDEEDADADNDNHVVGPISTGSISKLRFINSQVTNQFEFEKVVMGDMPAGLEKFDFDIEALNGTKDQVTGKEFTAKLVNTTSNNQIASGTIKFADNGEATEIQYGDGEWQPIQLAHGQKIVISGLPAKAVEFKISEMIADEHADKFSTYVKVNGQIGTPGRDVIIDLNQGNAPNNVLFENITENYVPFSIQKTVSGSTDETKAFKFKIDLEDPDNVLKWNDSGKLAGFITETNGKKAPVIAEFTKDADGKFTLASLTKNNTEIAVALKANETLTLSMPAGVTIAATELDTDDYDVSHTIGSGNPANGNTATTEVSDDVTSMIFNNHLPGSQVELQKKLRGSNLVTSDFDKQFAFAIKAKDKNGGPISGTFDITFTSAANERTNGTITFKDGEITEIVVGDETTDTLKLKGDEKMMITKLPDKARLIITEEVAQEYITSNIINDNEEKLANSTNEFETREDETTKVIFINEIPEPKTAQLKISKKLAGAGITKDDSQRDFNFRIFADITGEYKTIKVDQAGHTEENRINFQNGASDLITLKADETLTVIGLPIEKSFQVGEEYLEDFAAASKVNGAAEKQGFTTESFKLVDQQSGIVEFINSKDAEIEMGPLSVSKFVNDLGDPTVRFDFDIEAVDGAGKPLDGTFRTEIIRNGVSSPGEVQINGGNGNFKLAHGETIKFNFPMGVRYEISEKDYSADGYTTTVTKRGAASDSTTVTGTVTREDDTIIYNNEIEKDELDGLPGDSDASGLPGGADIPTSGTITEPDSSSTSGGPTGGASDSAGKLDNPMGLGAKRSGTIPQTGDDNQIIYMIIGVIMLLITVGLVTRTIMRRKGRN